MTIAARGPPLHHLSAGARRILRAPPDVERKRGTAMTLTGARGGTRTHTLRRASDFKSLSSASSDTRASAIRQTLPVRGSFLPRSSSIRSTRASTRQAEVVPTFAPRRLRSGCSDSAAASIDHRRLQAEALPPELVDVQALAAADLADADTASSAWPPACRPGTTVAGRRTRSRAPARRRRRSWCLAPRVRDEPRDRGRVLRARVLARAEHVEVAQRDGRQPVRPRERLEVTLTCELGDPVRRRRACRHPFMQGQRVGVPVYGRRGCETTRATAASRAATAR